MATKTTGSPFLYLSSHGKDFQDLHFRDSCSFNLPMIRGQCKIKNANYFFKFGVNYGISNCRSVSRSGRFQPKASASGGSPSSSSWKKWLMGLLLTVILPAIGHKGGLFIALKSKIDAAVKTVEAVTEMVEEVAEKVEEVAEEVEKNLPENSKLKEALDSVESLAKKAVEEAQHAEDLVHKVQDVEESIEEAIMKGDKDKTKIEIVKTSSQEQDLPAK